MRRCGRGDAPTATGDRPTAPRRAALLSSRSRTQTHAQSTDTREGSARRRSHGGKNEMPSLFGSNAQPASDIHNTRDGRIISLKNLALVGEGTRNRRTRTTGRGFQRHSSRDHSSKRLISFLAQITPDKALLPFHPFKTN